MTKTNKVNKTNKGFKQWLLDNGYTQTIGTPVDSNSGLTDYYDGETGLHKTSTLILEYLGIN